jgi:PleD family two-component response regulator
VLLWNLCEEDAAAKCEALERVIAGLAVPAGSERLRVAASAGMSMLYPLDTADEALARADRAMYARKRARAAE